MKTNLFVVIIIAFSSLVSGCAHTPSFYLEGMHETDVHKVIDGLNKVDPKDALYKQYVNGTYYLQFDRVDSSNVLYGWLACSNCAGWTRKEILAVYDGADLYLAYGHHEEFFQQQPQEKLMINFTEDVSRFRFDKKYSRPAILWNSIEVYKVEGRNLVLTSKFEKCGDFSNQAPPYTRHNPGNTTLVIAQPPVDEVFTYSCNYNWLGPDTANVIFVSNIDDKLSVSSKQSIPVNPSKDTLRDKLNTLKELYNDGTIDKQTYETKKNKLIEGL
jgi:hypothetical protein